MDAKWWLTGFAVILSLAAGCTHETATAPEGEASSKSASQAVADEAILPNSPVASTEGFEHPVVASNPRSVPPPLPQLIPTTVVPERVPEVETGRSDPFATLVMPPTSISVNRRSTNAASSAADGSAGTAAVPVASSNISPSVTALPPLPALQPAPVDINQLPSINVPTNLPPPQPLSETIAISGVIEVGGRTSVILQVPNEHTSRYAHVGDYLANGKVLIKRIEMGAEPVVILEEDGREVTRFIGGGNPLAGLM